MRFLALLLMLTVPGIGLAGGISFRLPLDGCDPNPGGCWAVAQPAGKPCYITAYFDLDPATGTAFACSTGCKDWNCGTNSYDGHHGTDIGVNGSYNVRSVVAAADGKVVEVNDGCSDHNTTCDNSCGHGWGNYVKLQHADGRYTYYGHMASGSIAVTAGSQVSCGTLLGRAASSGCSTGPHLDISVETPGVGFEDPFGGPSLPCATPVSYWTDQRGYCSLPSTGTCTGPTADDANFVSETGLGDGSTVSAGQTFTKSWTLRNSGSSTWSGAAYAFAFQSGDRLGGASPIALAAGESIGPGGSKTFSITLTVPTGVQPPANFHGVWQMAKNGIAFGDSVWFDVMLVDPNARDDAQFLEETIPDGTPIFAGMGFTKSWTLRNQGTTTWNAADGYVLAFVNENGDDRMGAQQMMQLPAGTMVAPRASYQWQVPMVAPQNPGQYTGHWRMKHGSTWFGDEVWVTIKSEVSDDADQDGYKATWAGGNDCDDNDPKVYPGHVELCNGKDDNCNGQIDEGELCSPGMVCSHGSCVDAPPATGGDGGEGQPYSGGGCGCGAVPGAAPLACLAAAGLLRRRRH